MKLRDIMEWCDKMWYPYDTLETEFYIKVDGKFVKGGK